MGRSFRNQRNDEMRNKRFEKIARSQIKADKENFSSKDDERIRTHNKRGFLDRFKNRNDPEVIKERIAKKKLKLSEQKIDTQQKLDKAKRPKSSWLQPQQTSSGRGSRGGRQGGRSRSNPPPQQSNSILDSSPGEGLNDLFGFSNSSTTKKKSSGIDGLTSLFG